MIELTGTLLQELNLKTDKNGNDYYYGWLKIKDGTQHTFFFFRPNYDLSMRLTELQANQELTLQGCWSQRNSTAFLASNFYLAETKLNNSFNLFENDKFDDWKSSFKN